MQVQTVSVGAAISIGHEPAYVQHIEPSDGVAGIITGVGAIWTGSRTTSDFAGPHSFMSPTIVVTIPSAVAMTPSQALIEEAAEPDGAGAVGSGAGATCGGR